MQPIAVCLTLGLIRLFYSSVSKTKLKLKEGGEGRALRKSGYQHFGLFFAEFFLSVGEDHQLVLNFARRNIRNPA